MVKLILVIALLGVSQAVGAGKWIMTFEPMPKGSEEEAECFRNQQFDPYAACDIKGTLLFKEYGGSWFCSQRKNASPLTCVKVQIGNGNAVEDGTIFPINITRTPVREF